MVFAAGHAAQGTWETVFFTAYSRNTYGYNIPSLETQWTPDKEFKRIKEVWKTKLYIAFYNLPLVVFERRTFSLKDLFHLFRAKKLSNKTIHNCIFTWYRGRPNAVHLPTQWWHRAVWWKANFPFKVHPKIHILPLTCSAIYQSWLFGVHGALNVVLTAPKIHLKNCLFSEITTLLLKIIHRPCCEQFYRNR